MRCLTLFFLTCCLLPAYSQQLTNTDPLLFTHITEQNGLSDDHVQCVLRDRHGFMWIGTADGLNRMDGSAITVFRHRNNDSSSLLSDNILSLAEDQEGHIWIGTTGGLCMLDPIQQRFRSYLPPISKYGAAAIINSVIPEKPDRIWIATDGGLAGFNPMTGVFSFHFNTGALFHKPSSHANKITQLIRSRNGQFWMSTAEGVWSFDAHTGLFKPRISAINDDHFEDLFLTIMEDHAGIIWAGNWQYGLKRLDPSTGRVSNFLHATDHPENVHCIREVKGPEGQYLLWLDGGLTGFDPVNEKFFRFPKPLESATRPDMGPCYVAPDGGVWLRSDQGLYYFDPQRQHFHHQFFPTQLTSQTIVFTEWDQLLISGAQSTSFTRAWDTPWHERRDAPDFGTGRGDLQYAAALSFSQPGENELWASSSEGIAVFSKKNKQVKWFRHREHDSTSLPRNFISHIFFDSHKQLWVFPWREGIWQMDRETGICHRLWEGFLPGPEHLKRMVIADAAEDSDGNIWMADLDEGIILYERVTGQFSKPFEKELGASFHVPCIFFYKGSCYAVNSSAILKWDPKTRQIQQFTPPPEMNKYVYDMTHDQIGNWWLATRNGLVLFNEQQNSYRRFTTADGLVANDMDGTLFCRKDGTMIFGTPTCFTFFRPEELSGLNRKPIPLTLTSLLVNDRPVEYSRETVLNVDHLSTNFIFHWALPDYTNPLKNQYYYRLKGIDTGWRYAGNKGELQFASLAPGHYQVILRATSANGYEAANQLEIAFVIRPPFWKNTGFLLLIVLSASLLFYAVVRYISQRNLKEQLLQLEKEQAVEKERNRISRDMHDDLGSGLTKIAILSEVVKKQMNEPEKASEQLDKISVSSRELVDNLQDIIWVLNPKNDTAENLSAYIREFALKFFESSGTGVEFRYPNEFPELRISEEKRRNLFLSVKEALHNAMKYAASSRVTISMELVPGNIRFTVSDNGRGFSAEHVRTFGNGLVNMRNRMAQTGGTAEISSIPGTGTTVTLTMPV